MDSLCKDLYKDGPKVQMTNEGEGRWAWREPCLGGFLEQGLE